MAHCFMMSHIPSQKVSCTLKCLLQMTIMFFTIKKPDAFLSEYLTDLSYTEQNNFFSKITPCGVWTHNLQIISLMLCPLCWQGICWRSVKWSFFCFMHHFTCWTLFISGINRAWLYKGLSDSQRQPSSDLAQWQSMRLMIWRLWVQTPLGAIFDEIYFVLCNLRSVR